MYSFTKREKEIIELLVYGKSNKEIAKYLYISYHTVKAEMEKIYNKTGIHNRVLLAILCAKLFYNGKL